jgi:hypothetical protein
MILLNKILGVAFGAAWLAAICYHFLGRHKIAKFYKESCFGLGSQGFWEKVIIVSTPIGILLALWFILSWLI